MSDTLRAAAQQALDALESLQGGCTDSGDGTFEAITVWCPEVIDALRAALAEPTVKDSLTVADTLPPLPERLRTYSADQELSDRYSDAMQEAADEIERLQAGIRELVAASGAETMGAAAVAEPLEPVTLADVLDALNLFNRPKPSEDDGPCEGGHFIRVDFLPAFINTIAAAWFSHKPMTAPAAPPQREPLTTGESGFMFQVGEEYETQAGELVRVIGRTTVFGNECLQCIDGMYRYDRKGDPHDAGRVTGTDHDYSFRGNFKRAHGISAPASAPKEQ